MRKISNFTLGLIGLTVVVVTTLICQFWITSEIEHPRMDRAKTAQQELAEQTHANESWQQLQSQESHKSILINYNILPDTVKTKETKRFLISVHIFGNLGSESIQLHSLDKIPPYRLLANMILRRDEIAYLNTTTITPDMLSTEQISSCYSLTRVLISDLKSMYEGCNCSHEQIMVMNAALGKLVYLTRLFGTELKKYSAFDVRNLNEEEARSLLVQITSDESLQTSASYVMDN